MDVNEILAENLRLIILDRKISWEELGRMTKGAVTGRHVRRIGKREGASITIDKLEAIAQALGLEPWILLVPDLKLDALRSPAFGEMVESWNSADPEGRALIGQMAKKLHSTSLVL